MNLVLVGVNHKTAPLELREKLGCLFPEPTAAYHRLKELTAIQEVLFYSTCNRVEILCVSDQADHAAQELRTFLSRHPHLPDTPGQPAINLNDSLYVWQDLEAVQHFFRVAASLDALVVGEPQILGQVKAAYRQAAEHRATGAILNRLLHKTFSVAKKVRTETGIGDHAVSVSYAAVNLGRKIFGAYTDKTVLLLGAGEMAELALEHLKGQGVGKIVVANRTLERGVKLAQRFHGEAISLQELEDQLLTADIILSSTGSPHYLLTQEQVRNAMRRRKQRPLFLIDIAVPRDLDPKINDLDNVYLYNIDDLQGVVELNWQKRRAAAVKAERLIQAEALKFMDWLATLAVFPTIIALKEKAARLSEAELKKTLAQLGNLTPQQRRALEVLLQSFTQKLLHDPIMFLKRHHHLAAQADRKRAHLELGLVRRLFNLDPETPT